MDYVQTLIMAFISVVLVNNLVLTKFLGICPYLGVSGRLDMAFGMGMAVTFVVTLSGTLTWLIYHLVLTNPALAAYGLDVTRYVCYILVIAGAVQLVEMYLRKFFPPLYESFGIFLPLITTNCAILGLCLFLNIWGVNSFVKAVVMSFGAGIGFTLAICIMAGIRENLRTADVPKCLKGAPITLITAGLLSLAFMAFSGMIK
jgi:electron transport complex protein RnfA